MIVLSCAHHRRWTGAINSNIKMSEYIYSVEINRRISNLFTMETDEDVYMLDTSWIDSYNESLRRKVRQINTIRPELAIENHLNSIQNPEVIGCETLYFKNSIKGAKLAELIQNHLLTIKEIKPDRGIIPRDDLIFLKGTTCTSIITEPLFLSNKSSIVLLDEKFLDKISKAIYSGIKDFLEEERE